jgi:hypothetical protein
MHEADAGGEKNDRQREKKDVFHGWLLALRREEILDFQA